MRSLSRSSILRRDAGLHRHHAAADIDADRARNDCVAGRDDSADRHAVTLMTVRHQGDMVRQHRMGGEVAGLFQRARFDLGTPAFDRNAVRLFVLDPFHCFTSILY